MRITREHALKLIRNGHALCVGHTTTAPTWADRAYGHTYAIIARVDECRTDHCPDQDESIPTDPADLII